MNKKTRSFIVYIILSAVVLGGLSIRLMKLGKPGLAFDEAFHAVAAQSIVQNGKPTLPSGKKYTRALVYTKLVAASYSIFGVNEFAARLPSVVFGTLTIILIFFVAKSLFGTNVGLISAIFLAFCPFEIAWSRECRMYAMFQFFFLFGFFAFYIGFENNLTINKRVTDKTGTMPTSDYITVIKEWQLNWKWLVASALLFYISFLVQDLTVFMGLNIFIYCIIMGATKLVQETVREFLKSKYFAALAVMIAGGTLLLITLSSFTEMMTSLIHFFPNWASQRSPMPLLYAKFLASAPVFPIGALFFLGAIQLVFRASRPGIYTLITVVVPLLIISLFYSELRSNRYIFNIFTMIVLISSFSLNQFIQTEKIKCYQLFDATSFNRYKKICFGIVVSVLFLTLSTSFVIYGYRIVIDYYGKEGPLALEHNDWKSAHDYIVQKSKPDDIVIPSNPLIASFYKFDNLDYMLFKNKKDYRLFEQKQISDLELFQSILKQHSRGWIISDPDRFYSDVHTKKEVRRYIEKNLTRHKTPPLMRLLIFSWDRKVDVFPMLQKSEGKKNGS